jgi:hypothetical protein
MEDNIIITEIGILMLVPDHHTTLWGLTPGHEANLCLTLVGSNN